jgi:NADH:ubiquinone oxidoreductase subunit D
MRFEEIKQSMRIIKQALKDLPDGPFNVDIPEIVPPPKPDVYKTWKPSYTISSMSRRASRSPRGDILVDRGPQGRARRIHSQRRHGKPYRLKLRVPTFMNLQTVKTMSRAGTLPTS